MLRSIRPTTTPAVTSRIDSAALSALGLLPTRADLDAVRAAIRTACADGLAREGGALAMLPAFLPPPSGAVAGDALAFDAGVTMLRAAWVRFDAAAGPRVLAQLEGPLPGAAGRLALDLAARCGWQVRVATSQ